MRTPDDRRRDRRFGARNRAVLQEAQAALNLAFGAILSAYVGNSLTEIDDRPFDHALLGKFFVLVAVFILGLCVGNALLLRREFRLGGIMLGIGGVAAGLAHHDARLLGFEVVVLRVLSFCWVAALLGSDAVLTAIVWLHHRGRGG